MYIPKHFEQPSVEAMHALISSNPFAALVTYGSEGLCANHIPMELHEEPKPYGTLVGHVARANPVWREVSNNHESMVIFQGANIYITPSWYPSKKESGKVVPTWNYAVVHAHGYIRVVDDAQWVKAHIEQLINRQESSFAQPWTISDAPREFIERLILGVVGIEIPITRLVGKWKVSQNQPESDRGGIVSGLCGLGTPNALQMAEYVERFKS
jgi:transcriptional regulator